MSLEKVVYTAKAKATGGRDGRATSSDGVTNSRCRKRRLSKVKSALAHCQPVLVSKRS
ncbi:MAG: hypothetical protein K0S17_2291 [Enterobacter mori]|nr:hypothetical protein [Enterobacter mori]